MTYHLVRNIFSDCDLILFVIFKLLDRFFFIVFDGVVDIWRCYIPMFKE